MVWKKVCIGADLLHSLLCISRMSRNPTAETSLYGPDHIRSSRIISKRKATKYWQTGCRAPSYLRAPSRSLVKRGMSYLTHHQIVHSAAPNAASDIRYAAIFRLRHVDCEENGYDAYTDIWKEWPGIQEAVTPTEA